MPLYPSKVLRAKEHAPTLRSFAVFCLGFTFESLKELGACHLRKIWIILVGNVFVFFTIDYREVIYPYPFEFNF